jgi:hypothetical protein
VVGFVSFSGCSWYSMEATTAVGGDGERSCRVSSLLPLQGCAGDEGVMLTREEDGRGAAA